MNTTNEDDTVADSSDEFLTLVNAGFRIAGRIENDESRDSSNLFGDKDELSDRMFEVAKFNITLAKGEVLAVCGPVAAGKVSPDTVSELFISVA